MDRKCFSRSLTSLLWMGVSGNSFLADPKTTICQELGITMAESLTIKVHESDMQTVHLALPPDPNITEEQLASDLRRPLLLLVIRNSQLVCGCLASARSKRAQGFPAHCEPGSPVPR